MPRSDPHGYVECVRSAAVPSEQFFAAWTATDDLDPRAVAWWSGLHRLMCTPPARRAEK